MMMVLGGFVLGLLLLPPLLKAAVDKAGGKGLLHNDGAGLEQECLASLQDIQKALHASFSVVVQLKMITGRRLGGNAGQAQLA